MSFTTNTYVNHAPQIINYPISSPGGYGGGNPPFSISPSTPFSISPSIPFSISPSILKKIEGEIDAGKIKFKIDPVLAKLEDEFKRKPRNLDRLNLETLFNKQQKDVIIIARPLSELFSHIKNFQLPSLELIARAIKTLALSIFRWHLCDQVLLKREGALNLSTIYYNLDGKTTFTLTTVFKYLHPYLLENAYFLTLKEDKTVEESNDFSHPCVSPDTLRQYFKDCYEIEITDKETENTISDLFKSSHFDLKTYQE